MHRLTRRGLLALGGGASIVAFGGLVAACSPSPQASPAATKPAAPKSSPAAAQPPAASTASAPAATQAPAKQTYQTASVTGITIANILDSAWWQVGKAKGFFQEYGIDIDVKGVNGGNQVIAAMQSGDVDFADQSPSTMLTVAAKDGSLKAISGSRPGLTYYFVVNKQINSLKDLEGSSVGIGAVRALIDQVTRAILKKANVDANKVTFASIGSNSDIYKAVVAGKIGGGMGDLVPPATVEQDGIKILLEVWKEFPSMYRAAFWVTPKTIAEKGDVLVRMLAAYAKTYRYLTTPESKDLYLKVATEVLAARPEQAQFQFDFLQKNPGVIARNLELPEDAIMVAQQLNVEAGNMEKTVPFEQVTDLSLQKKALALLK